MIIMLGVKVSTVEILTLMNLIAVIIGRIMIPVLILKELVEEEVEEEIEEVEIMEEEGLEEGVVVIVEEEDLEIEMQITMITMVTEEIMTMVMTILIKMIEVTDEIEHLLAEIAMTIKMKCKSLKNYTFHQSYLAMKSPCSKMVLKWESILTSMIILRLM